MPRAVVRWGLLMPDLRSALPLATLLALALPAAATAAVTVELDDGSGFRPAAGLTTPSMVPDLRFSPATDADRFAVRVTGPDGKDAAEPVACATLTANRTAHYRGNGPVTVTVTPYATDDRECGSPTGPSEVTTYTVATTVTLTAPARAVLFRAPGSRSAVPVEVPLASDPFALTNEVRFARGGRPGADGGLPASSSEGGYDPSAKAASLLLPGPGTYTVVARALGVRTAAGEQFSSPWSAPVTVKALAPFDIEVPKLLDARGPSYALGLRAGERSTRGKVRVSYARGLSGGRFRSLGTAKLGKGAAATKRFRLARPGTYRLRVSYAGGGLTAAGTSTVPFTITGG